MDYQEEFKRSVELFLDVYEILSKLKEDTWIAPNFRDLLHSEKARMRPDNWAVFGTVDQLHPLLRKAAKEVSYYAYLLKYGEPDEE
jgi:hypothetical protein